MKAHVASSIHAFSLILMGVWGYIEGGSMTAFIPVVFGAILLPLNNGIKHENKVVAHIAVLLTVLVTIALIKPLMGAIESEVTLRILRVAVMVITGFVAIVAFVRSFIAARKKRA